MKSSIGIMLALIALLGNPLMAQNRDWTVRVHTLGGVNMNYMHTVRGSTKAYQTQMNELFSAVDKYEPAAVITLGASVHWRRLFQLRYQFASQNVVYYAPINESGFYGRQVMGKLSKTFALPYSNHLLQAGVTFYDRKKWNATLLAGFAISNSMSKYRAISYETADFDNSSIEFNYVPKVYVARLQAYFYNSNRKYDIAIKQYAMGLQVAYEYNKNIQLQFQGNLFWSADDDFGSIIYYRSYGYSSTNSSIDFGNATTQWWGITYQLMMGLSYKLHSGL